MDGFEKYQARKVSFYFFMQNGFEMCGKDDVSIRVSSDSRPIGSVAGYVHIAFNPPNTHTTTNTAQGKHINSPLGR